MHFGLKQEYIKIEWKRSFCREINAFLVLHQRGHHLSITKVLAALSGKNVQY